MARQDNAGAKDPEEGGLRSTETGQDTSKKTAHLNNGTGPAGMAVAAGVKAQGSQVSRRNVPSLPKSDKTADREADAKNPGNRAQADSRNVGAKAATKSTGPRKTARDKDNGAATKPPAVQPAIHNIKSKSPDTSGPPAQKPSEKPGAAVTRGAAKQHLNQRPVAGKPTGGSTRPAPVSIQRKDRAQHEPHAATPRSTEHNTAAIVSVAPHPSSKGPPAAVPPPAGQGPSGQSGKARGWPLGNRKRRAASAPSEDGGRGSKRSRLEDEGEADWRAAPVIFAQRPEDSVNNVERDGDARAEEPASGVGHVNIQGEGGGHAADADGKQLALAEKPSGIELTKGYGAVMGIALGAGAFALRHWT